MTYSESTALSLVTIGILLIAPHAAPVEPVDGLGSLFSTANIGTTSIGKSVARAVIVVAAVVLRDIPVEASISGISDDIADDWVDLLSACPGIVCMTTCGGVNDWTNADFLDGSVGVCAATAMSRVVNILRNTCCGEADLDQFVSLSITEWS